MTEQRSSSRGIFSAIIGLAIAAMVLVGCGGGEKPAGEDAPAPKPVLLVAAAKAEVHPMKAELHLLGKTVATRHVIIRAPTPGRVIGLKLVSGDSVRKGQVVAHVINREIEAAEAGLAVAKRIDPQEADTVRLIFKRYLELGSVNRLVRDLKDRGLRSKVRHLSTGATRGGASSRRTPTCP